jgi:hypothetical protein
LPWTFLEGEIEFMRRALAVVLAFCIANVPWLEGASARPPAQPFPQDEQAPYEPFSPDQLDNLLSPIALYPDPLLAQVLVAATFVDQVDEAARYVRANGTMGVDDQDWDVSVKSVAHYPTVIEMMADKIDWTTSLGQAYVNQSTDVEASIQRLRHMARDVGNLVSTPQQEVLVNGDYIAIDPYQPQFIYVPVYDPYICFHRRPFLGVAITFGAGFAIGAWLNRDWDWGGRGIYYHGWGEGGRGGWHGGWIDRCRPNVRVTNVYVNNRYNTVIVNRTVVNRTVNVTNINRFNSVHRNVTYNNIQANNMRVNRGYRPGNAPGNFERPAGANNKIMDRNIDRGNPQINQYRGREITAQNNRPPQSFNNPPREQNRPPAQPQYRGGGQPSVNYGPHTFNRNENNFDPRMASQRGQASRQQASQFRAAPQPRVENRPAPRGGGERKRP